MMCNKILAAVIVFIAVVLGILAIALKPEQLTFVILISRFFEVMIPILGVGALLKYLFSYHCHHHDDVHTREVPRR